MGCKQISQKIARDDIMLIKAQNGLGFVSLKQMHSVIIDKKNDGNIFIVGIHENRTFTLGQYSSVKVAKKVLDNLLRDYKEMYFDSENEYWYKVYEMPEYQ